ncbi:MAG: putative pyridoxal-dependent aspartate 1-decarboxylase [Proteobacteria bacterium]|nr:putative pyridoxal-dependent aspartate 1-decarboxylase [Pseudomonadota bacterium]
MRKNLLGQKKSHLVADWNALERVFIRPENEATRITLVKYMEQILFGLHEFLNKNVGITEEISLKELSKNFTDTRIGKHPEKKLADVITDIVKEIAPHAVNVASPYFVGHMTSAIPFFMVHLKTIVSALNQNVVKLETSKVVSVIEKQVIAKIHRLIYNMNELFYQTHVQNTTTSLGCFTEGGTSANLTALWVARNAAFPPKNGFKGIEIEGLSAAFRAYNIERAVVLVSVRAHKSLKKSGGILGIGNQNVIAVDVDDRSRIDISLLKQEIRQLKKDGKTKIIAIVGIAGSTETGSIDPLREMAEICKKNDTCFHVDAAWGGPTLMSEKYRHLLNGIELADSVTIDGHKQFYMPMSCGMLYFKDPSIMDLMAYHANYINRRGSVDLGIKTFSGSREANSLILDSALKIMGTRGYALLIEHGIEVAADFAEEIESRENFELVTKPVLNILTYRVFPKQLKKEHEAGDDDQKKAINARLNEINRIVQQVQREAGNSFVSRTAFKMKKNPNEQMVVLRCVMMNPMTNMSILKDILDEQEKIYLDWDAGKLKNKGRSRTY